MGAQHHRGKPPTDAQVVAAMKAEIDRIDKQRKRLAIELNHINAKLDLLRRILLGQEPTEEGS